jgi:hypothetical protein
VDVGEEDGDFAAGGEELRDLDGGDEVAGMGAACGCGACEVVRLGQSLRGLRAGVVRGGYCVAYPSRPWDCGPR